MALDPTKNFAYGLVEAGGHSAAATSFNTLTGYGAKFPATADGAFNVVWWNVTDYSNPSEDPNVEIVRVTARAGEAFTVTRAQESTSASTKNTSGKVYAIALCMTKKMVDDISTLLAASDAAVAAAVALVAGITNASTTTAGLVELATEAQALAGTATGETGAKLVVTPDVLQKVLQGATMLYAVEDGSGSDDTYTWATTPVTTARVTGSVRRVKLTVANTGACTGNENSLGALTFKKYASGALADLETGDIVANMTAYVLDDGTYYVLLNPGATMPTTALLSEMATFFGATDITGTEAETLTGGATSNADALHTHSFNVLRRGLGLAYMKIDEDTATSGATEFSSTVTQLGFTQQTAGGGGGTSGRYYADNQLENSWDKSKVFECWAKPSSGSALMFFGFGLSGAYSSLPASMTTTQRHVGFIVDGSSVYGSTADGTTQTKSSALSAVTGTTMNNYRVEFDAASAARFYVNGTLKATISTTIPTGSTNETYATLVISGVSQTSYFTFPEIWFAPSP